MINGRISTVIIEGIMFELPDDAIIININLLECKLFVPKYEITFYQILNKEETFDSSKISFKI